VWSETMREIVYLYLRESTFQTFYSMPFFSSPTTTPPHRQVGRIRIDGRPRIDWVGRGVCW
jgi:hypothetical protein